MTMTLSPVVGSSLPQPRRCPPFPWLWLAVPVFIIIAVALSVLLMRVWLEPDRPLAAGGALPREASSSANEIRRPVSPKEMAVSPTAAVQEPAQPSVEKRGAEKPVPARRIASSSHAEAEPTRPPREAVPVPAEDRVDIGMPRAEVLRVLGEPDLAKDARGTNYYEALKYGRRWVVLKNGAVQCVRTRLEYSSRHGSDCNCAGMADSIVKF